MLPGVHYPRIAALGALLTAGFLLAEARLFYLQILRHDDLGAEAAKMQGYRHFPQAWRGQIRARNGETLVFSYPTRNVYANLSVCSNRLEDCARILADSLHRDRASVLTELRAALSPASPQAPRQALCLKRNVLENEWRSLTNALAHDTFSMDPNQLSRSKKRLLKRLRSAAVFAVEDQARIYTPAAASLGPLLGFTRVAAHGQAPTGVTGLERIWNGPLTGSKGLVHSRKNAGGQELAFLRETHVPPLDGNHVVLTIDPYLQELSAQTLSAACRKCAPSNAIVLIIQPRTGEIFSWVSWPYQDPNYPSSRLAEVCRNYAIMEHFEPGSTFKMITLAAALNENLAALDQRMDGEGGRFRVGRTVLRDRHSFGALTLREATAQSVNIIFAKLAISLGPERFLGYITNFGFGRLTGVPLPGEVAGQVKPHPDWTILTQTQVSFGQGIAATPLQMAMAACALGNEGKLPKPVLVKHLLNARGEVVWSAPPSPVRIVVTPQTARLVLKALTEVTSVRGTGRAASLQTHSVAGKTGTAQIANGQGYLPECYYASFIGLVPAREPRLCILVAFTSPRQGPHSGGALAAPVFQEIAEKAVRYLDIPPDKFFQSPSPLDPSP